MERRFGHLAQEQELILVDTSVWAAFFNDENLPQVNVLDELLASEQQDLIIIPIIFTEVLQGFRSDAGFNKAKRLLRSLVLVEPSLDIHEKAAMLFRRLRRSGVTVRGAIDCLIAQVCLESGCNLLTLDRDFQHIARHTKLKLIKP